MDIRLFSNDFSDAKIEVRDDYWLGGSNWLVTAISRFHTSACLCIVFGRSRPRDHLNGILEADRDRYYDRNLYVSGLATDPAKPMLGMLWTAVR